MLVVGGVVAGGVWSWCVAERRRVARENAYVASEMIREFVGGGVPFRDAPKGFSFESDPSRWPGDPIPADQVEEVEAAVSYYDLRYPARAVTVDSLRRAYGRDFARNIRTRRRGMWVYDVKEYEFIAWCRKPADLVYKRDVTDDDGVVHHKGEEVNDLRNVSNYSFITNSNSHSYKDYVFASAVK
ncbi:hypothetical protein ACOVJL_01395 [Scardovia wiggsiae]|uniref:hypothetical protein n=1 Tax=Scardovia wiggsiae TaxID=230143 RepID=UPI003BA858FA